MACALQNLPPYARERIARSLAAIPYVEVEGDLAAWLDEVLAATSIDVLIQIAVDEAESVQRFLAVDRSHVLAVPAWPSGDGPVFGMELDGDQAIFACIRTEHGVQRRPLGDGFTEVGDLMQRMQVAVRLDSVGTNDC
jgi:hypothetical protein